MTTELGKKKAKDDFEKDFFKLMNTAAFGKTMKNVTNIEKLSLQKAKKELIGIRSKLPYLH